MSDWYSVLFLVGAFFSAWFLYRVIKDQPEQFSSKNLFKTTLTLGYLAVVLIAVMAISILSLRS
ncbi:MAG: hypothetical protein CMF46_02410 [Legionellales bacterium]|nr:hypothetical protein [Legionellales bacterium]